MFLLMAFAFIAGIVTILSPCILPVLPFILSGSTGTDKRRPWGVVLGFILSFTFFTLFLTSIVQFTGVSADILRYFSIVVLFSFGASLLIPQFQLLLEKAFTMVAGKVPNQASATGLFGGLLVGFSLGLLWTPCVGPILASVISLALTGSVNTTAFFITFAYALGTALPMLAIMKGGQTLLQKNQWLVRNTATIQKGFGVLMMLTALAIFNNFDRKFQTYILQAFPQYGTGLTAIEDNELVKKQLETIGGEMPQDAIGKPTNQINQGYKKAPELQSEGAWINSEPLTLSQLKAENKVVLIDFWTYSCINCIRTLPYLRTWHEKYVDQGLTIIGVHAPEFEFEKDLGNLQEAVNDFSLFYPIVQDNEFKTWRAYENRY
jgi:cytochrome c biogenesis protein CcdA/thiol-disulfide isomerase/thioredoxin